MFGITPIIFSSPIPSHPSTEIVDQTIRSIKHHLPNEKIIVLCDGVRPEQEDFTRGYRDYIHQLLYQEFDNKIEQVVDYQVFLHQVGMMRQILPRLHTNLLLFMEADTPLVTDEPINWYDCCAAIDGGAVNLVRFLHEAHIHEEHAYLMRERFIYGRSIFTRTVQFSARPHLASVDFYRKALQRFTPEAVSFLEDKLHSVCQDDPWEDWKLSIYTPEGGNQKRSLHLDGRAGGPKFDDSQVF